MTKASFPDWRQEILSVHGDETGGAFEWIGRGTLGGTIPIEIHGCTVVDVNEDGLVTRWRDYFDLKEIERQIAGIPARRPPAPLAGPDGHRPAGRPPRRTGPAPGSARPRPARVSSVQKAWPGGGNPRTTAGAAWPAGRSCATPIENPLNGQAW